MMDRRAFIYRASFGLLAAPLAAEAQQAGRVYRIGVLAHGEPVSPEQHKQSPFRNALRELGWIEGHNIAFEDRRSVAVESLDDFGAELVRIQVDLILAIGTPAALAAKRATSSIPTVVVVGGDPVSSGLVASLPRPGANITGMTALSEELQGKRVGLMKELIPRLARVAYMWNPTNPGNDAAANSFMKTVAARLGVRPQSVPVRGPDEFEGAFSAIKAERAGALLVAADGMLLLHRTRIAELAAKHRVPAMYSSREHVHEGGLILYSVDWVDLYRHVGVYADRILKGARPADLPMAQPTKYELVINLKTAKALGLTIPPSLLQRADQVIE